MIDTKTKDALNDFGERLSKILLDFYGKVTFNFYNGRYVNLNIEQSIKNDNLKKGVENDK
ncbi:MAG TPA: hypothetical protein ENH82_13615 [bacterium]|nr:hypothetical protein [bacterium]